MKMRNIIETADVLSYKWTCYKNNLRLKQKRRSLRDEHPLRHFDTYKCLFIHIPRTGGVSVSRSLFGNVPLWHISCHDIKKIFGERDFNSYFKFTFVRNPWDRVVSAFFYFKAGGRMESDKKWAEKNLIQYNDFSTFVRDWINPVRIYKKAHFIPQYKFICEKDDPPQIDFIGHFESLQRDFNFIKGRLGIDTELQHLNPSKRTDYKKYYTEETKGIIAHIYHRDLEIFGYDFENSNFQ